MTAPEPYYEDESVRLFLGDCLAVLPGLPDSSIDAIVTDPPYGLEFMGREWDGAEGFRRSLNEADAGRDSVFGRTSRTSPDYKTAKPPAARIRKQSERDQQPGAAHNATTFLAARNSPEAYIAGQPFQAWCQAWAAECLRVLKPGGHMLAFGGTRTWHRLTCGIEDAGFEIRDGVADLTGIDGPGLLWLYGCLTVDAEILTEHGWKPGIEVERGEQVAQWDHETGHVSLAPVQEVFRAPWDGPMRVLRNADTDQLLTPNHRVYHQPRQRQMTDSVRRIWYDDCWQVAEASELSTWNSVRLPIAGEHDGPGVGGEDYAALLGWVWTEGGFDLSGSGVRIYQSSVNAAKVTEIADLMDRLGPHKRYDYERTYTRRNGQPHPHTATTWFFTGDLAARVRADLPGKRPTYGLLWRMTGVEKRALLRAAMLGDGSGFGTRSEQFYQQYEDDLIWFQTLLTLVGRSGKVTMRGNRPGGSVALRQRGTTELQARHLRDSTEHYTGEVWCVRVPTGAFVARRNGRVFITGNSGFPKSLDVSKAIDKHLGATRPVVGRWESPGRGKRSAEQEYGLTADSGDVTISATAAAAAEGWGTALKPAWEPVVVARKPLAGTVARNFLEFGTGALNIDGCRVGTADDMHRTRNTALGVMNDDGWTPQRQESDGHDAGRWPPNVVLGEEAAAELDRQSGVLTSGANPARRKSDKFRDAYGEFAGQEECTPHRGTDSGGASRFFPVFRHETEQVCALYGMLSVCERASGAAAKSPPNGRLQDSADSAASAFSSRPSAGRPDQLTLSVPTAGTPSRALPGTTPSTAHATAPTRSSDWNAPRARSAGSLCGSCATAIAQSLAAMQRGQSPMPTLGLPSTDAFSERILTQNLALYAEALESSATTSTTTALTTSLGCVAAAISACITRESGSETRRSGRPPFKYAAKAAARERPHSKDGTAHPTVKPVDLMAWLVRLVTPPGGTVLDPFGGSGTTAEACIVEGFRCVLIEQDPAYAELIKTRLRKPIQPAMFGMESA